MKKFIIPEVSSIELNPATDVMALPTSGDKTIAVANNVNYNDSIKDATEGFTMWKGFNAE